MVTKLNRVLLEGSAISRAVGAGGTTLTDTDYIILVTGITGGGDTITLPVTGITRGATYKIYDESGGAATNNITIDPTGATLINGAATVAITTDYGHMICVWTGTEWLAEVSAGGGGATNLSIGTTTGTTIDVNSDTGTNATIPQAIAAGNAGVMSGTDKTKLDGIESGATADQSAAEILAALLTVDGSGSGLDADVLDGYNASTSPSPSTIGLRSAGGHLQAVDFISSGDITVTGTVDGRDVATDGSKLDGIEALADVTDATNVDAAGAVMNSDATTAAISFVVDEDNMVSDLATKVPTQQSVKAYVDDVTATDTTFTGDIVGSLLIAFDGEYDNGTTSGAKTIDWNNGNHQKVTIGAITTLSFTAPTHNMATLSLRIIQDGTGYAVTLPTILWPRGSAPTITTTASAEDIITLRYNGTSYYASIGQAFA